MANEAYQLDGQWVDPARFYAVACDPQRSVVVEACAGAGKTWMLVSRILRAMLDGVPPQQVLAITFTRKAAGEMRERLHHWLADFAHATPEQRDAELRLRGVPEARLAELSPRLGALHGEWLAGGRGVEIHTIHGWFSRLVKAAPLDLLAELNLPPELQLLEDTEAIWPELWARCLRRIDALSAGRQPEASAQDEGPEQDPLDDAWLAFHAVIRAAGRHNTQAWLLQALHNRLEVFLAEQGGALADSVPSAAEWDALRGSPSDSSDTGRWAGLHHPSQALARASVTEGFWALARAQATAKAGSKAAKAGEAVALALAEGDPKRRMDALLQALFTKEGQGDARKQLGDAPELAWAQAWLHDLRQACAQQDAHVLHRQMVTLSRLMMAEYADFKRERGLADMADLELAAARLLSDEALAGWVQQRLDSQVRQVLMDEFQDTSPLQWQALRAWLSAYAGAGGGGSGREPLQVFLVGDPKQSIYRFRRADPRVFEAAKAFVIEGLGGHLLACDHTRRNAPGVLDCLNRVMGQAHEAGEFPGYRTHTTTSQETARIRVLPSVSKDSEVTDGEPASPQRADGLTDWRDTLRTPRLQARATVKAVEAAQLAQAVAHVVRQEGVPADEVFVLSRTRATLALVAESLDALGVPHVAPDNTPLIDTPEVRDLVAVVESLVSPRQNLALAHALKSPVFGVDDAGLMALAARATQVTQATPWWDALQAWAASGEVLPPALARAAQLLSDWRALAAQLPPHDLLTRIVTQGEVRHRVLACVPPSQRAQALWHIDALLAHTLEMDAGRDATPYRWIRALRQQSPTLPARAQAGAVQLLTIHGAKGLEAQVVFMLDTDPLPPKRASYALLVDWPDNAPHPERVAFVQAESAPPPSLAAALDAERLAAQREELNALYVALTRARAQLVFSRSVPSRASSSGAMSWWQRLVASAAIDPQAEHPDAAWCPASIPHTAATAIATADQGAAQPAQAVLAVLPALLAKPLSGVDARADSPTEDPDAADPDTRLLGQAVHRALEGLTAQAVSARSEALVRLAVQSALRSVGLPAQWQGEAEARTRAILFAPELQPWLDPQHLLWAGNEVAVAHEGQTLRLDRLVARQTAAGREWWVIDYKLNAQPDALLAYRQQLRRYIAAVSHLQPGEPVRAAFISGKGQWLPMDAMG